MAQRNASLATISSAEVAEGTSFNTKQVDLIREQIMPGASDDDLMLFVQVASSRGLDPFRKHIYAVSRRTQIDGRWIDKWTYQISIDGLRLIAERSGKYEGQTIPLWCGEDGVWKEIWLSSEPPAAAKVGVYRRGSREPIYAIALYKTCVQKTKEGKPTKFWAEMPELMLAKNAESQALRKAFPEETQITLPPPMAPGASAHVGNYTDVDGRSIDPDTGEIDDYSDPAFRARVTGAPIVEITDTHESAVKELHAWLREVGREYDDADRAIEELSKGKYKSVHDASAKYVRGALETLQKLYAKDENRFATWLEELAARGEPEDPPIDRPALLDVAANYTS